MPDALLLAIIDFKRKHMPTIGHRAPSPTFNKTSWQILMLFHESYEYIHLIAIFMLSPNKTMILKFYL